jgi:hypothetical protein
VARAKAAEVRQALADLVIGGQVSAQNATEKIAARGSWLDVVTCSGAWRVAPRLRTRLTELGVAVDDDARAALRHLGLVAAAQASLVVRQTTPVLARLEAAGVEYVVFKGIALIASLYGDHASRAVGDLDILVAEHDLEIVDAAAAAEGFQRRPLYAGRTFEDWEVGQPDEGMVQSPAIDFTNGDGVELDVHASIGLHPTPVMCTAALIRRAERHVLDGCVVTVASPMDAQLLTVHHALRANFKPVSTLKDLCDLAAWWDVQPERWCVDDLVKVSQEARVGAALLGAWRVLAERDPESPAALIGVPALERALGSVDRRDGNRLARLFDHQLALRQLNHDLLTLLCRPARVRRIVTNRLDRASSTDDVPPLWRRLWTAVAEGLRPRRLVDHVSAARIQRRYR